MQLRVTQDNSCNANQPITNKCKKKLQVKLQGKRQYIQLLEYPIPTTTTTPAAPACHKKRQVAISWEPSVVS